MKVIGVNFLKQCSNNNVYCCAVVVLMELVADWWNCSLADDHYVCLRQKELRQLPTYRARSPQLGLRLHVVDWLAIVCDTTGICMTARHLAVALLDYFMDHFIIEKCHITLVALSCLHIAGKDHHCWGYT